MMHIKDTSTNIARAVVAGLATFALLTGLSGPSAMAADQVTISSEVNIIAESDGDVVAIGGEVKVSGHSTGDLIGIGGRVEIDAAAEHDAVFIGGELDISGAFAGNLVVIGGKVNYSGANTSEMVLIGGEVEVDGEAVAGGPARIFGGELSLAGRFAGDVLIGGGHVDASGQFADTVVISARNVEISGQFYGDLQIEGEAVHIKNGAVITGHLTVSSPAEPIFADGAAPNPANYTYEYIEEYDPKIGDVALSDVAKWIMGAFLALTIIVGLTGLIGFIIVIAAGTITQKATLALRKAPGKSFLVGLVTVFVTCFIGIFFMIIVIGPLLPLLIGTIGFFIAAIAISTILLRSKAGTDISGGQRLVHVLVGSVILAAIAIVPIAGCIVVMILSTLGVGAFILALFNAAPKALGEDLDDDLMAAAPDNSPLDNEHKGADFEETDPGANDEKQG